MKKLMFALLVCLMSLTVLAQETANRPFKKSFSGEVEAGTLLLSKSGGTYADIPGGYYSSVSLGMKASPKLYTGVAVGIKSQQLWPFWDDTDRSLLIPILAHVRYNFIDNAFSPFLNLKAGMQSDQTKRGNKTLPADYPYKQWGFNFKASTGVEYSHVALSIGYDWTHLHWNHNNASWTIGLIYRFN